MVDRIESLPGDVVHLMAAGEVIDSFAAVVRELAENAVDAGASRIAIALWEQQWRIQLADNGRGLSLADLQQAALPHRTSKIRTAQDLWRISSLGFRGEALHSLAQLSDLEVCSRCDLDETGWRVQYDHHGQPTYAEAVAIAPGTIVTVSNLFANWMPRREGLPSLAQQYRAVQLTIQKLALCHPHITWQVHQSDRPWFSLWAGQTARDILPQCLRDLQPSDLREATYPLVLPVASELSAEGATHPWLESLPTDRQDEPASLYLLLGLPDRCHRRRADWVHVAVNGRIVQCPELEQTVLSSFRRTLPRDRQPVCFVHLRLPAQGVDWNRHPAKLELYLHHLEHWQTQLRGAIAQALHLQPDGPTGLYSTRVGQVIKSAEQAGSYPATLGETPFPNRLKAIAQVHQMYIVVEHPGGVWLIEQHIAHERVLYEQLRDRWQLVPLEPPLLFNQLTAAAVEQLQRIGMGVEPFGEDLWAVRTVPEPLSQRADCRDAVLELSLGSDLDAALVAIACRTALRNGTPLTLPEMQTLVEQWQATQNPHTCPHGRPICLSLEESSLSRFFRRHWVIGKSHGI